MLRRRQLILLVLLTVVTATTAWRVLNPKQEQTPDISLLRTQEAPTFQLLDQNNRPSNLRGYLGRHRILLAFFDGSGGPDADPVMQRLKAVYPALKSAGVRVLAISTPLGPKVKPQCLSYPFPVLRDTSAGQPGSSCVRWGVCDETADPKRPPTLRPSLFLIDRRGLVASTGQWPRPESSPQLTINSLL